MAIINQYRLYCNDEADWITCWAETEPNTCPNDPVSHTIDPVKTTIIDTVEHDKVDISNDVATINNPDKPVQRIAIQPGRSGYYLCDRDVLIRTAVMTNSFEDLKVNCTTQVEETWGEVSLAGVFKSDGGGGYTPCTDDGDAASNAVLSIWDYNATDQADTPAPVDIDVRGGCIWVDDNLTGNKWEHKIYSVIAPYIPTAFGGQVRFFDGYLHPHSSKWLESINTMAVKLDPSASPEAARLRTWIFYPAGAAQEHVLRYITYRAVGTF